MTEEQSTWFLRTTCFTCGKEVIVPGYWPADDVVRCLAEGHEVFRLQKIIIQQRTQG